MFNNFVSLDLTKRFIKPLYFVKYLYNYLFLFVIFAPDYLIFANNKNDIVNIQELFIYNYNIRPKLICNEKNTTNIYIVKI